MADLIMAMLMGVALGRAVVNAALAAGAPPRARRAYLGAADAAMVAAIALYALL